VSLRGAGFTQQRGNPAVIKESFVFLVMIDCGLTGNAGLLSFRSQ
jgi:hypothetical protein